MSLWTAQVCYLGDDLISEDVASFILCVSHITPLAAAPNINISCRRQNFFARTDHCRLRSREPALVLDCRNIICLVTVGLLQSSLTVHRVCLTLVLFPSERRKAQINMCLCPTVNSLPRHGIPFFVLLILPNGVARGA